jgi:hypothetical protein
MKIMRRFPGEHGRRAGFRVGTWIFCGLFGAGMSTARATEGAPPDPAPPAPVARPAQPAPGADPWTSPQMPGASPQGGYAPAPFGAAPPDGYPPGAPGGYAPPDGGFIRVDVKGDAPGVRLDRVVGPGATAPICFAPCSRVLSRNNLYVIQGDGVRTTSQFLLPDDRPEVELKVHAGSAARQMGGTALIVVGIVAAYVGLLATAATAATADDGTETRRSGPTTASVGLLGGGVAVALGGLFLVLGSNTTVNSSTGATFTKADPPRKRARSTVAVTANGLEF